MLDYHVHCIAHGDRPSNEENYLAYIDIARTKGIQEIGFVEHDEYLEQVDYPALLKLKEKISDINIRIGVEMEMPATEEGFLKLARYPLDFVMASIHIIDDWMFDHPDNRDKYSLYDNDELYKKYFLKLALLLGWEGYNIIGHMDLIKVFGLKSNLNFKPLIQKGLQRIVNKNCAVELNTAGLFKPAQEIYPAPDLIEWLFSLNIPITISSDAHRPEDVGRENALALEMAKKAGYTKLAVFDKRRRYFVNI